MSILQLAFQNFKTSFKNYLSLIVSLAFTILIFFNFQNMANSSTMDILGSENARNIEIIMQAITFVLVCFMIFFIWYATNVFLAKRKKEIGIYIFMGLTHQKIGQLYMIETTFIGLTALLLGLVFGLVTAQLFMMILMAISEISVPISFDLSPASVFITVAVYLAIYMIFVIKGYINIIRSSVLEMVSATRKNEYVQEKSWLLVIKAILGIAVLGTGFYFAIKEGGIEVMGNVLIAVVLVVIGIYLLFGGLIPLAFQKLARHKFFLYKNERTLWINNIIFRMKKNYRTYAMTAVLMLCSITALATGFAMKNRYDGIVHFRHTYIFQALSDKDNLYEILKAQIEQDNDVIYGGKIEILQLNEDAVDSRFNDTKVLVSYSQIKDLAESVGLDFDFEQPDENSYINVDQLHLMSFITDISSETITINQKTYHIQQRTDIPYLGYFQEMFSFYLVNDNVYEALSLAGDKAYIYNYQISNPNNFAISKQKLQENQNGLGLVSMDPNDNESEWIKVLYSVCIFMFMVFVLASGCILFMKIYNDAFEEKERYLVLTKLGISENTLKKAVSKELLISYGAPFLVMAVSSYFSVHALAKVMQTELLSVNVTSVLVIFVFFVFCYFLSRNIYLKNTGIQSHRKY